MGAAYQFILLLAASSSSIISQTGNLSKCGFHGFDHCGIFNEYIFELLGFLVPEMNDVLLIPVHGALVEYGLHFFEIIVQWVNSILFKVDKSEGFGHYIWEENTIAGPFLNLAPLVVINNLGEKSGMRN